MCRDRVSQDCPGFGSLPRSPPWGILQGCNPVSNAWGAQGTPSIRATACVSSVSPLLRSQNWGSLSALRWTHLSEWQESLPGCCAALGVSHSEAKKQRKAVNGAWKLSKHRQPARELRGKTRPKETTSGHSQEPGYDIDWAGLEPC